MKTPHFFKRKNLVLGLLLVLFFNENSLNAQKVCIENNKDQIVGLKDGFRYELWNQYAKGHACMTISDGALFSGEWSDIENYLARRGLSFDKKRSIRKLVTFTLLTIVIIILLKAKMAILICPSMAGQWSL
ncbi:MAG: glycoside hydrolase family 11 protein [Saprospiraceae bacterium]|nr:glycoside hydrolase family 11 protein [Saprospiraceae bacterium]